VNHRDAAAAKGLKVPYAAIGLSKLLRWDAQTGKLLLLDSLKSPIVVNLYFMTVVYECDAKSSER